MSIWLVQLKTRLNDDGTNMHWSTDSTVTIVADFFEYDNQGNVSFYNQGENPSQKAMFVAGSWLYVNQAS